MSGAKWWHDADNYRRWEAWNAIRKRIRAVPTLGDWLFSQAMRCRWDDKPVTESRPPWERT
jgi:hypothetical protein